MTVPRRFAAFATVFAVVYAIVYVLAVDKNWALFSYYPATGTFGWLVARAPAGPSMYWYGWLLTAALAGAGAGLVATVLPDNLARRLWPGLAWLVPLCVLVAFGFLLRGYFLR